MQSPCVPLINGEAIFLKNLNTLKVILYYIEKTLRRSLFEHLTLHKRVRSTLRFIAAIADPRKVQHMAHFFLFGFQVMAVMRVGRDDNRQSLDDLQTVAFQADYLLGVIGQQADLPDAKYGRDIPAPPVNPP
jgi:hypothetical protein